MPTTRLVTLFLLVAALTASAGCGSKASSTSGGDAGGATAKLGGVWESEPERVKMDGKEVGEPITLTVEFKADGAFRIDGFFPLAGTWKLVKDEGNTLTVETEVGMPSIKLGQKTENGKTTQEGEEKVVKERKTFTITFDGPDAITMTNVDEKPQPMKLKRKK